jgi:NSS family neurotransmitter:Na+ symporter
MSPSEDAWSGRLGFILAAIGSAIGLGNIWRFAYVAGENGGAVFLLVYAVCVLLVGLPVLISEFVLGHRARGDLLQAFRVSGASRAWSGIGVLAILVAFLILSYYSVIAGWACRYFWVYLTGQLPSLPREALPAAFEAFIADPTAPVAWHALFMVLSAIVVTAGVARGIERASRVLMPLLAVMVILLAGYALSLPGAEKGLAFLFTPDWSALRTPRLYIVALGQTFFSLGVAMGVMIVYAGYVRSRARFGSAAVTIALSDTLFAVIVGMAIFPIVFAFGMDPAYGAALAFVTLPQVFAIMPAGAWIGTAFFFLLSAAALTSAVSLLEVPVAAARRAGVPRVPAALGVAALAFVVGVPSALGPGVLSAVQIGGRGVLEAVDYIASSVMLPVVGLAVVLYTGWVLPRTDALRECGLPPRWAEVWLAMVRYVAPLAMIVFLLTSALG